MDRHIYLFLLVTLLGIAISPRSFAQPTPTAGRVIREIVFRGLEHFSPNLSDQLAKVVKSRVGEPYTLEAVVADKQALQELGWFAAVETATMPVEGGVRLFFLVVENAPVISVEGQGLARAAADQRQQVDKLLKTLAGQPFSKKMTDATTEKLLAQGIFNNAFYKQDLIEGGIRLTFIMVENPIITAIGFTGIGPLTEEQLRKAIKSQPGDLLNQNQVSSDAGNIRKAYADNGYTLAQITDLNVSPEGNLNFNIFIPTISEIRITGNVKTTEAAIREQLTFKVGDYYNEKAILASLEKIRKLPLILEAKAIPESGIEKGTLCITINIRERNN